MLNKLSFNIFNELNESESKKYKVKKRVLIENDGIKTINEDTDFAWLDDLNKNEFDNATTVQGRSELYMEETAEEMGISEEEALEKQAQDFNVKIISKKPEYNGAIDVIAEGTPANILKFFSQGDYDNAVDFCETYDLEVKILNENKSVCEKCGKEPCECDKTLNEKDSEKLGGDPNDFVSDVQTILDTLNQIDTSSFGTKLAQQMIEDWVETCERQIEKGKRLASGDEFYSESSLTEDEYGDNPIKTNDKYQLYKSMKGTDIDGVTYSSYLVRDNNGNGVRSFIAKNDIEASKKFNESSMNEDSIEDNDLILQNLIKFLEDNNINKKNIEENIDKIEKYLEANNIGMTQYIPGVFKIVNKNGTIGRIYCYSNGKWGSSTDSIVIESSMNEDSIEDAKNDSIKKGLYSESSTSLRERFKKFLDNNVKNKDYNFDAYIDDLTTQYGNTGTLEYELSKSESKSGKPELFNYSEEDLKELGYNLDEAEENTEIDWDKPRYGDDILDNMWTAVCSNDLNYVKNAFNKNMIKPNTRYQTGTGKHSLIMGALRNNNFEMVDLLKSFGEKIQKSELEEYKKIMSSREYEDDLTKSSIEEAEEMQVKNLQVIKEQGNVYMLQDENKKMIVGENYNPDEGMIENAEVYENKDEADKDYLNRCEILKGNEDYKDDLKEAKTVKEYRIIDTTDNKVLKTFKTEDKEKGYTEMRKMGKKLKDEGKKDNLIYKEYKVKK